MQSENINLVLSFRFSDAEHVNFEHGAVLVFPGLLVSICGT